MATIGTELSTTPNFLPERDGTSASRQHARRALRAPKNWKKVIAGGFSAFCPEGACAISHGRKPVDRVGHDLQPQRGDSKTRINACYPLCSRPVGAKIHICIPSTGLRPWLAAQALSGQLKYFSVCKTALFWETKSHFLTSAIFSSCPEITCYNPSSESDPKPEPRDERKYSEMK